MASIYKEVRLAVSADRVWEALRDFYALHRRLVTACEADGDTRVVTFFNGQVAREQLVGMDDRVRRVAYTSVGGKASHHHASAQVFAEGPAQSRLIWITDVLPDELAAPIGAMMDRGAEVMRATLDAS